MSDSEHFNSDSDDDLDHSYKPPKNYQKRPLSAPSKSFDVDALDGDKEVWVFRVPSEIPLSSLKGLKLRNPNSHSSKSAGPLCEFIPAPNEPHAIYDLTRAETDGTSLPVEAGEAGELSDLSVLFPSSKTKGYKFARSDELHRPTRVFSVVPTSHRPPTDAELKRSGEEELAKPAELPEHPEGLKFQCETFGFSTSGEPLKRSLARYNLNPIDSIKAGETKDAVSKIKSSTKVTSTPTKRKAREEAKEDGKASVKKKKKVHDEGEVSAKKKKSAIEGGDKKKKSKKT
ncbi:hypothetical protein DFS34DRAFT_404511 [Phlyctochytrium arcticum]|nr:hypothetical protein DFS34DRAFT_404511 [Phlyctochytrium arcticum]